MKHLPWAVFSLLLAGCTVGPDYVRPSATLPAAYKEAGNWKPAQPQDLVQRGAWWLVFQDATLNALEAQLTGPEGFSNQNLRLAESRYRQAEALARGARAALWPSLSASASVTRSQSASSSSRSSNLGNDHSLGLAATWEADVWGRVRRNVEANQAASQASAADLAAALLSAQASLAQDYFLLRAADEQKRLLDDTLVAYEKSLQLTRNRYQGGIVSQSDVAQAETQLHSTRVQALDLGIQRAQLEHAIAVLIGKAPAELAIAAAPLTASLPPLPPGLPSELLERRPDIGAAERRVAAANAQIGVAQAAFFPSLTLSASGGFDNASFAQWLTQPSRFWSLGPSLATSLFDAGLRRANSDQAIASYDAAVATYRQTVLTAFQEVEDNLASLRILAQESAVLEQALAAARRSLNIASNQYQQGMVAYLNVVTAQATALGLERNTSDLQSRRLVASVLLAKATGGGWQAPPGATPGLVSAEK